MSMYAMCARFAAEKKRKLDFDNPEDAPVNLVKSKSILHV